MAPKRRYNYRRKELNKRLAGPKNSHFYGESIQNLRWNAGAGICV
jgi:hypothetical protein